MSNEQIAKSVAKATRPALERLDKVEGDIKSLVEALNQTLGAFQTRLGNLEEVFDAVVTLQGTEIVQKTVQELRLKNAQEEVNAKKQALELAISKGLVTRVDTISAKSIIVGQEKTPDGQVRPPGRVQLFWYEVFAEIRDSFLGAKVGETRPTPKGNTFEILEVYDTVEGSSQEQAIEAELGTSQ